MKKTFPIFVLSKNSDQTEGRGPMVPVAMHFALDRIKSKQAEENLRRHDVNCGYNIQK